MSPGGQHNLRSGASYFGRREREGCFRSDARETVGTRLSFGKKRPGKHSRGDDMASLSDKGLQPFPLFAGGRFVRLCEDEGSRRGLWEIAQRPFPALNFVAGFQEKQVCSLAAAGRARIATRLLGLPFLAGTEDERGHDQQHEDDSCTQ